MPVTRRKWIFLSPFRRSIVELMRLSRPIPLVTAERTMNLAALIDARQATPVRPNWSVIFSKAFALLAARRPALRRAFMSFPWVHLYEHPVSVASIMLERTWGDEEIVIQLRLKHPEHLPLMQLHESLQVAKQCPLEELKEFRQLRWMGGLPWGVRQAMWNFAYYWRGDKRAHYFGTFGLSSPASEGAGLATIVSPVTCTLHYGLFDDAGRLDVRLTFDHRVIDGAPVARALAEIEQTLLTEILAELKAIGFRNQNRDLGPFNKEQWTETYAESR